MDTVGRDQVQERSTSHPFDSYLFNWLAQFSKNGLYEIFTNQIDLILEFLSMTQ